MKPRYAKEYKKFGLAASRKPQTGLPLAGVVQVVQGTDSGYAYVKFSEALVEAVGRAMPQGISQDRPCYLRAVKLVSGKWRVSVYYLGSNIGCILWEVENPGWLKKVRKGADNGTRSTSS